ncbi:translation initiation factor eIF-2B [Lentibacillus salinarum]|uniref:Translation initiation factor eIF-2B n=1 Tax=Lentibacillus salinarum TaxID=446820 RepID=A0ABW3ZWI7_9BACI
MMQVTDIEFKSAEHVIEEIENMNVKGGSPFGRAAAWAYKLVSDQEKFTNVKDLKLRYDRISSEMLRLKPTMATIYNSKKLVYNLLDSIPEDTDVSEIQRQVSELCASIINYSLKAVDSLGEYGSNIIQNGDTIMMHSYSSALMSIFIQAASAGKKFSVICTESRPLRESRLAAKILQSYNVPVTYITDASVWEFMPVADYIMMGADTISCNGSVANKMGTALISKLAQSCKKKVYIASEIYKIDLRTQEGQPVVLERRTKDEVIQDGDFDSLDGIDIINQFFDLTPAPEIEGIICEFGVVPPSMVTSYWGKLEEIVAGN